ncbi:MAG: hypothetical protein EA395_16525, partial [Phormidium sp. GEM2.Bin31]
EARGKRQEAKEGNGDNSPMLKQNNSRGAPYMARPHKQTLVNRRNPINESLLTIHHQRVIH